VAESPWLLCCSVMQCVAVYLQEAIILPPLTCRSSRPRECSSRSSSSSSGVCVCVSICVFVGIKLESGKEPVSGIERSQEQVDKARARVALPRKHPY